MKNGMFLGLFFLLIFSIQSWGMDAPSWMKGTDPTLKMRGAAQFAPPKRIDAPVWMSLSVREDGSDLARQASHYEQGTGGLQQNTNEALRLYSKAIDQHGSPEAKSGFSKLVQRSCSALADQGHPGANFSLAKLHDHGIGVPQDMRKAEYHYLRAAQAGHAGAQFSLSVLYGDGGGGVARDHLKAFQYLKAAADSGHPEAECNLGITYLRGQQDSNGAYFLKSAADKGDAKALYNLGKLYVLGRGVGSRNDPEAVRFYQLASAKGHAKAANELKGMCTAKHHLRPYPPDCQDYGKS